ncbi:hypothetical protein AeRB84_014353 [Aphanomyces euteiches]|nr:hypothetical protein AeRB84_014353 [Aphanomyces euteiches]
MQLTKDCTRAALILSAAFLLVFTAYGGIETLETSIISGECKGCLEGPTDGICQSGSVCQDKVKFSCDEACAAPFQECKSSLGNTILGIVYLVYTVSAFFGSIVLSTSYENSVKLTLLTVDLLGKKWSLFGSSFFYALFAFANLMVALTPHNPNLHSALLITAAALLGMAASVLWISQASYITQISVIYATLKNEAVTSSMGHFNGIFFSIFNLSSIAGNLISSLVLGTFDWSNTSLFLIYTVLGLSGTALFFFLPSLSDVDALANATSTERARIFSPRSLWTVAKDTRMLTLLPVFLFGGILRGFALGEFTSNVIRESLGSSSIGYAMALYGGITVVGSFGFGKLADRYGPWTGMSFGYVSIFTAYCLCYSLHLSKCDGQWSMVLCIAILLSIGDSTSTTLTNVVVGQEFPTNAVEAFSLVKAYQSAASAVSFGFFKYLSFHGQIILLMTMTVLALVCFTLYTMKLRKVVRDVYVVVGTPAQ